MFGKGKKKEGLVAILYSKFPYSLAKRVFFRYVPEIIHFSIIFSFEVAT